VPLGHNNTLNVSRAFLGAPVELELRKTGSRRAANKAYRTGRQSLAHEPGAASLRGSPWLRAPVDLELHKAGIRGSPCRLDTTTRSTFRVLSWAPPSAWNFVKPDSGARRATWTQQHAQRFACFLGRPVGWNFVKPCSGARRATWTQQHAQRFACFLGRPRWLVAS
jgi:hypothetical protein